jgi:predicted DNA repair protein MutK
MASGLFALLDDIAVLAKAAAASVDDLATAALKASAKSMGVVIDDAAVTPQYVRGIAPKRELPVIKRITLGSLRNKFLIILPLALILSTWAPATLPWLLLIGGSYLAYEGAEKVLGWFGVHLHGHDKKAETEKVRSEKEFEDKLVGGAVRTDLILSTEIMLISLANVESSNFWERLGILVIIAFVMTIGVYGVVAVLVKMDDVGVRLAQWPGKSLPALGRGLVKGMPHVFTVLSVVGPIAMLWVGGHSVVKSLYDIGLVTALYDVEHTITHAVEAAGGVVQWLAATLYSAVVGCVWGIAIVGIVAVVSKIRTGTSTH